MVSGAQDREIIDDPEDYGDEESDIVVLGYGSRGAVLGATAVEVELNEADIASYGASNIEELISQLAPLTRSSRGQGGGSPIMLLNGRRIANRRELYRVPAEAIERVQVLPEEVALRYGYPADQRVINFILKTNFDAITAEVEYGWSGAGEFSEAELEANYLRLTEGGRISLEAEYNPSTRLLESDRNIRDANGSTETGRYRTLLPETDQIELNGLVSQSLSDTTGATLNLSHEHSDSNAWLGLDGDSGRLREKDSNVRTTHLGATLDGAMSGWKWTMTANADWQRDRTELSERGGNIEESTLSRQRTLDADVNVSGKVFALPAGDVLLGLRAGIADTALASERDREGVFTRQRLERSERLARANLDLPLFDRGGKGLGALGDISVNLNGAVRHLSDYGSLYAHGYGATWKPSRKLSITVSKAHEKNAPGIEQLGAPLITTPGVTVYDFVRGESVLVDVITGGNPALTEEKRADLKIGLSWDAPFVEGLTLLTDYYDNSSTGRIADFPLLTPEVEAAFPERIVRDAGGGLVSIDQRGINFTDSSNQVLRYGFSYSKSFGAAARGERPSGGRSGARGAGGRREGGRWNVDLFHSVRLKDEITIRPGLTLDLLDGDAIASNGGSGRHLVELEGGWSFKGLGIRASAKYQSGSRVDGDATSPALYFSDLFTMDLRAFVNLDQNERLVARDSWLKGMRLRFKIENLTDTAQTVRDAGGTVPLSYQPGYQNPRGRFFEISLRKQF